jgi:hypothetical protein
MNHPIVSQFKVAADFWSGMVEPDYQAQASDPSDLQGRTSFRNFSVPHVRLGVSYS